MTMTRDEVAAMLAREGFYTDDSMYAAADDLARALLDARAELARLFRRAAEETGT